MGITEVNRRTLEAEKMLQKHGATYSLLGDPEDHDRPWELDLIPYMISFEEWQTLESGLLQRARLINAILKDIYGEQLLLKRGLLPPELVFANPGFFHPCSGIDTPGKSFLSFFAVDLCRTSNGTWNVLSDHVQMPVGPGFVLENRVIMSQVLSRIFHQNSVMRLAPFFISLQEHLREASFYNRDNPEIILLSPGPSSETYFEQAFLSRYLGYPMVEGGDLTVRDNRVYIKTLGGLEPVNLIFRWINDMDSDPLVLRCSTDAGVPGLIHAARGKTVSVVNPIGSGAIEHPGFSTVFQALSKTLFGEDLMIPDLPKLWFNDPAARNHVLENTDRYDIFHWNENGTRAIPKKDLFHASRNDGLYRKFELTPYQYAAQEQISLSTLPIISSGGLVSRSAITRFYISATRDGFQVMPGGLARICSSNLTPMSSQNNITLSKDIWIQSDGPVEQVSLLGRLDKSMEIRRSGDLPSRTADNLLWLGLYLERAEHQIRLFRSIYKRLSGEIPFLEMPELPILLKIAADKDYINWEKTKSRDKLSLYEMQEEMLQSVFDKNRPLSLSSTLKQIHRTASNVRGRLSLDSWRVLARLEQVLKQPDGVQWIQISDTYDLMSEVLVILSAFSGLAMESMTRGLGWRFLDMGRRIGRAQDIISCIQSAVIHPVDDIYAMLDALLEVADSSMTYRYRYRTYLQVPPAMDLLLADDINPRSLAFQLVALSNHVDLLPRNSERKYTSQEEKVLLKILTTIRLADINAACRPDENQIRTPLQGMLQEIDSGLREFTRHITQHYLSRIPTTQHFSSFVPEERP